MITNIEEAFGLLAAICLSPSLLKYKLTNFMANCKILVEDTVDIDGRISSKVKHHKMPIT